MQRPRISFHESRHVKQLALPGSPPAGARRADVAERVSSLAIILTEALR